MDEAAAAKPGLPKDTKPKNPVRHKIYRYLKKQQELVTLTLQTPAHDRSGHHRSLLLNKSLSQNEKSLLDLSVMKKTNRHLAYHLEASRVECRRHQNENMRLRSHIHDLEVEVNANEQELKRLEDLQMQEPERTSLSRQMEEASVMLAWLTTMVLKMQQTLGGGENVPTALPLLAVGCNDVPDALSRIILRRSMPQGRTDAPASAKEADNGEGDGTPSVSHPANGDGGGLFNLSVIMEKSHVLHELSLSLMEPCGPEEGAIVDTQSDRDTSQSEAHSSAAGQRHLLPDLLEENSSLQAVNPHAGRRDTYVVVESMQTSPLPTPMRSRKNRLRRTTQLYAVPPLAEPADVGEGRRVSEAPLKSGSDEGPAVETDKSTLNRAAVLPMEDHEGGTDCLAHSEQATVIAEEKTKLHDAKSPPRRRLTRLPIAVQMPPMSKRPVDGFGEGMGRRLANARSSCKSPTSDYRNMALFVDETGLSSPPVCRHPKGALALSHSNPAPEALALDPGIREEKEMPPNRPLVELGMPDAASVRRPRGPSIYEELSPIYAKVKRNKRMAVCDTSLSSSSDDSSDDDWVLPGRRQLKACKRGATKKTAAGRQNRPKKSGAAKQQVPTVKSRQLVSVKGLKVPPAKQTARTTDCVPTPSGTKDSQAVSCVRNGSHPENSVSDDNRSPLSEITHHRASNTQRQEETTTDGGQRPSRRARNVVNYKEQSVNVKQRRPF